LEQPYTRITSKEERRAPEGKYRVMLNDRGDEDKPALYFVSDHDNAEEAFKVAESLQNKGGNPQNGIVQDSKGWGLYPWFDGHQIHTREELTSMCLRSLERGRSLDTGDIDAVEAKQAERIPGWKPGDRLIVFWSDIEKATGAKAYVGDF
jgi:hypothetical protein